MEEGYIMNSMRGFSSSEKAPRWQATCRGGLERENDVGELVFGQNPEENKEGEHLQPCRYLAKPRSMLMTANEL